MAESSSIPCFTFFPGRQAQRISIFCYLLALKSGLERADAELLRMVAPTHSIPDGCYPDAPESNALKSSAASASPAGRHAYEGADLLQTADDDVMTAASIVAWQRYEHWDGSGYPRGLKGRAIHIFGRITGLATVFDSLMHWQPHGRHFDMDQVLALIRRQRGRRFDPQLVDIFLQNPREFIEIGNRYPEEG